MEKPDAALDDVVSAYEKARPSYEAFVEQFSSLLMTILRDGGIDYHVVEGRAKTVESFEEKLKRPGKSYGDPLVEVPDICGCRVIVHYVDEVRDVADIIRREFDILEEELSHQPDELDADRFGYLSAHYVVKLNSARRELTEWRYATEYHIEVQIRTVIQHAWSVVSHAVQYKRETSVPSKLRRRLFRLAGLFELADEEFIGIREQRLHLVREVSESLDRGDQDIPLSTTSIEQAISRWKVAKKAEASAIKAGFRRGSDDQTDEMVEDIYLIASKLGIRSIADLEKEVGTIDNSVFERLAAHTVWHAHPDFLFFVQLLNKHPDLLTIEDLRSTGWAPDAATYLLKGLADRTSD